MRVKVAFHKKPVACGGCGKEISAGRSYYLPAWKGGGGYLCGRCGLDEMKRASKSRDDVGAVQETIDLSVE